MTKENHMGIIQKPVILQLSNPSVASTAGLNQNVIWGIVSPNRGLTSHEVLLLDEVSLLSKIAWERWLWWTSNEIWILLDVLG